MLRFHDTAVLTRELDSEPIAESAGKKGAGHDPDAARNVAETDHRGLEVVTWTPKDDGCGGVEDIEPDEVGSVAESRIENHGPS